LISILPSLCLAIYPIAQAAASLTPGSKSSRHATKALTAPELVTAVASSELCFEIALNKKQLAFL